jgi:trehalose-phosphatase
MEAGIGRAFPVSNFRMSARTDLTTPTVQAVIDAIQTRPADTRLVFLSDFDGTLADFHDNPVLPWPSRQTQRLLAALAGRDDLSFGVVSGRRLEDVRARTVFTDRAYFAGLHGLEISIGAERWTHPELPAARGHVRALADRLVAELSSVPGLHLEDKEHSIAAHFRRVRPEDRGVVRALVEQITRPSVEAGAVRELQGDLVLEFLPNVAWDKGAATRWIARHVEARFSQPAWVVFVGDDVTDELAFVAIERGIGVLVGSRPTAAQYQLDGTRDVTALLAWLTSKR